MRTLQPRNRLTHRHTRPETKNGDRMVTQHDPGSLAQWVAHQNAGEPACVLCGVAYQFWSMRNIDGEPWPSDVPLPNIGVRLKKPS